MRVRTVIGAVAGVVVALLQYFYLGAPSVMDKYPTSAPSFVDNVSRFWQLINSMLTRPSAPSFVDSVSTFWYLINSIITRPYVALVLAVSLLVLSWYRRHDPKGWTIAFLGGLLLPYAVFWIPPR